MINAVTAFIGVALFAAAGLCQIQRVLLAGQARHDRISRHSLAVDHLAIYFFYLFLAATAISILISVRYLETEHESHGEYYALMLLSVAGMMCMAGGVDVVLIFIGLETDGAFHLRAGRIPAPRPAVPTRRR